MLKNTAYCVLLHRPAFRRGKVVELAPPWRGGQNMWHVYILKSLKDGRLYIGCTNNLQRRLGEHNKGQTHSTRLRAPFEVVHSEPYQDRSEAYQREKLLKKYKGGNALKRLLDK